MSILTAPSDSRSVLVVDDDEEVRESIADYLRVLGYSTRTAENGQSALKALREELPAVIVTDIFMPQMDGIELVCALKAESAGIPIVTMSGGSSNHLYEALAASQDFGAVTSFTKPLVVADLARAIQTLIGPGERP